MRHELDIWIIGGDQRQVRLAGLLAEDGHTVHTLGLGEAGGGVRAEQTLAGAALADCVVLPLPVTAADGLLNAPLAEEALSLEKVLAVLRPGQVICAGRVDAAAAALARDRGLALHDYFAREELAVANAVPTAEGAIQIALEEMPVTLHGSRALVIGYGRLGRALAPRLAGLGAKVSVAARKYADLAWAEGFGFATEHTGELRGWLCGYDLIVNTVPVPVLGAEELGELKPECVVIDLASLPGGVDLKAAQTLGVRAVQALSLPGRVAPATAAAYLRSTICHILNELGV
ncbi:dipicolinate synthase subunit DpsA [uncultured Flavonifractor sp.]|uniref:dipicolinate synthase subunit DpsA n=1 Tax=uncultured Flavonifractor sp. TaxID=1193534 RepID=UPI00261C183C|nr:dipicolinate synthase subunit DpsA [uncultured Flavonifractor sp.]